MLQPMSKTNSAAAQVGSRDSAVIECRGVWKIYGSNAEGAFRAMQEQGSDKNAVGRDYNCTVAVADASFTVYPGEIFCIMGLSGSGKSTLLRHVNGLIAPTGGDVYVDGTRITGLDHAKLRQLRSTKIGMVFQNMALWPHFTVRENITFVLEINGVPRKDRHVRAEEALAAVNLSGWGDHYPDQLSGGMQQRVGFARALAIDPAILLMDEPFSALDPLIRRQLQDQFVELARKMGKTVLFITHDLDEAIKVGDRVAIMKDGVIAQIGTPLEIINRPANEYVSDFVRGVSRLQLLRADAVMEPLSTNVPVRGNASIANSDTPLSDILDRLAADPEGILVLEKGQPVGWITQASVLKAIRGRLH